MATPEHESARDHPPDARPGSRPDQALADQARKADPEAAGIVSALRDAKTIGKGKGGPGRAKGSKNRNSRLRIEERILKVLAAKSEKWWNSMLTDPGKFYLAVQLAKAVLPRPPVEAYDAAGNRTYTASFDDRPTMRLMFRDEQSARLKDLCPAKGDAELDLEFDSPEHIQLASDESIPTGSPSAAPAAPEVVPTGTNPLTIGDLKPDQLLTAIRADKDSPEGIALRQLIADAAKVEGIHLAELEANAIRAKAELRRERNEAQREIAQVNRRRMFDDDSAWTS